MGCSVILPQVINICKGLYNNCIEQTFNQQIGTLGNNMGNLLRHPITDVKFQQLHSELSVTAICASMQGWRQYMEDYHTLAQIGDDVLLTGVFDGHGGPEVACFVSRILGLQLQKQPFFQVKSYSKALANTFKKVDQIISSEQGEQQLVSIRKQINPQQNNQKEPISSMVGTTANVLLLTSDKIYVANIGDSRSVLCRNGQAIELSQDHKPLNAQQKQRITKAGGHINHGRVNGSINISRTFGDFHFKQNKNKSHHEQMIISVPEVKQIERNKQLDQYIVIASDGVWEKYVTNSQGLIDKLNQLFAHAQNWQQALTQFLHSLVPETTREDGGYDNMTLILVLLDHKKFPSEHNSERNQQGGEQN